MYRSCLSLRTSRYPCQRRISAVNPRTFASQPRPKDPDVLATTPPEKLVLWATIEPTSLTVFHNPNNRMSEHVLRALQAATIQYPPQRGPGPIHRYHGPLKLNITVHERPPTADEFRLLLPLQSVPSFTAFLSSRAISATSSQALVDVISQQPDALNWPVVVDWEHGDCSIGGGGYRKLLDNASRRRKKAIRKPGAAGRPSIVTSSAE
ncbi:hypothetical protein C8R45DRAFT_1032708 [Mycena sanguinolenta]|nr:hypothetical protein C8R45DRAFT_1032708 [Mycena sanguinolenta]